MKRNFTVNAPRLAAVFAALVAIAAGGGCSGTLDGFGIGGGRNTQTASVDQALTVDPAAPAAAAGSQAVASRFPGSDYCPKIEIRHGTEAFRKYVKQNEPSRDSIVWQASISETARQCEAGPNGTMSIKVGVSGRVLAGPKGGPGDVSVPIRIAVVKFREAVLASNLHNTQVTIDGNHSTVFRRVYRVEVPSPGADRDYIIYVGFDDGKQSN